MARVALAVSLLPPLAACKRPEWAKGAPPPVAQARSAVTAAPGVLSDDGIAGWARPILGKSPREAFPRNGVCIGNTDGVRAGQATRRTVYGWGWNLAAGKPVERVILVDINYRIVGAGEGRVPRADVDRGHPEYKGAPTGWMAGTNLAAGPMDAFGVVEGGAICPLGHIEG